MRVLLVTFTFGLEYAAIFERHFRDSVVRYCDRVGYDFRQVREPLDGFTLPGVRAEGRLAQKVLVGTRAFAGEAYDAVVWLDADVFVTPHAPDVVAACGGMEDGRVCGTNQNALLNPRARLFNQVTRGYEQTGREWYRDRGLDFARDDVLQSGVLVFYPRHHSALCAEIYAASIAHPAYRAHGEDQPFLSYEFLRRGTVRFIDWEWNAVWPLYANFVSVSDDAKDRLETMTRCLFVANFVHFASRTDVSLLSAAVAGYDALAARVEEGACPSGGGGAA